MPIIEKAVCLNLDHRFSDGERLRQLFEPTNIPFERFVVGKGRLLSQRLYSLIDEPNVSPLWQNGPYKNFPNSYHAFRAFQHIITECKTNSILLLEDDAHCTGTDIKTDIEKSLEQIPDDWDMIYLGANHTWATTVNVNQSALRVFGSLCFHAVVLKNTVFSDVLSWVPTKPIDTMAAEQLHTKFNCYAVWPNLILQKPGHSYVEGKTRDYSEFWSCRGNPNM